MKNSIKLIPFLIFTVVILTVRSYASEVKDQIVLTNKKVKAIERNLKNGKYSLISLKNIIQEIESVPPIINLYYSYTTNKIVVAKIEVGHETWSKSFSYYFDQKEKIIKYLEIISRPDNPPKRAIIYGSDRSIIWKNTIEPTIDSKEIRDFFKKAMFFQTEFSKY